MDRTRKYLGAILTLSSKRRLSLSRTCMDFPCDGNATRLGKALDARSDVGPIAHQVLALHNDLADMDADPQL